MKKWQLFIFDWDGTLVDSVQHIVKCLRLSQQHMGLEEKTDTELKNVIGLGLQLAIARLFPQLSETDIKQFVLIYRQCFLTSNVQPQLFDGARQMLHMLKKNGAWLAVATGKGSAGLRQGLAQTGLQDFFHATRCADQTRSKPHPQMLEEILEELGLEADSALMIGDTEYDLQMAQALNMDCLGVSYGVHDSQRLRACRPIHICDSVSDLQQFLQSTMV